MTRNGQRCGNLEENLRLVMQDTATNEALLFRHGAGFGIKRRDSHPPMFLVVCCICLEVLLAQHYARASASTEQFAVASQEAVPVSPLMADRYVAGTAGRVEVQLKAFGLQDITVGGRHYEAGGDFPTFVVLDRSGRQRTLRSADAQWRVEVQSQGRWTAVTYSAHGLEVQVKYFADVDRLNVIATVLGEGDWRLVSIGGTILTRAVLASSSDDYLIDGAGRLVFPDISKTTERKWDAQFDFISAGDGVMGAAFIGWRERDRIVYVKPLTFSHWLAWSVVPRGDSTEFAIKAGLYFRPPETKLFATKLCHDALAIRIETAGDVNGDRHVDWVDAGLAYRERYIKPIQKTDFHHRLRDAFRVYYDVHSYPNYNEAFSRLLNIDFADGIWWSKGMMEPASWEDFESHKFTVKPNPKLGPLASWKHKMNEAHQWVGPYYGHDYIVLDARDWPDTFIKRDPLNKPFAYYKAHGTQKYYKDNVRSVATGEAFQHYEQILKTCLLQRGDPIMLDTFIAGARPSYNPDYPATAELEGQAKHRIAAFLRNEKGLILAAEGIMEGGQDVTDYAAVTMRAVEAAKERIWEKRNGMLRVPMLPTVFLGASYYGAGWYELRNPNPNWAIGLVYGVGYWDWLPQGPAYAWMRFARYYFNQSLVWSQVADAKVRDVEIAGSKYAITYDNGISLKANVAANKWVLEKDSVRYDGFTPFNNRGYMAVLAQGDFEITLPGEHQLEISPHQPFREKITFETFRKPQQTIIRGRFGHLKWRIPIVKDSPDGKATRDFYDADPVLVLRKVN